MEAEQISRSEKNRSVAVRAAILDKILKREATTKSASHYIRRVHNHHVFRTAKPSIISLLHISSALKSSEKQPGERAKTGKSDGTP